MDQVKLEEEEVEGGLCRQIESKNVGVDVYGEAKKKES